MCRNGGLLEQAAVCDVEKRTAVRFFHALAVFRRVGRISAHAESLLA